jgi:hypothetical protein
LILCRVRQRTFVLEHLSKITAVHPTSAGWAMDEMLGLTRRRVAETLPKVAAARNVGGHLRFPHSSSWGREAAGAFKFFVLIQSRERPERYVEPLRC